MFIVDVELDGVDGASPFIAAERYWCAVTSSVRCDVIGTVWRHRSTDVIGRVTSSKPPVRAPRISSKRSVLSLKELLSKNTKFGQILTWKTNFLTWKTNFGHGKPIFDLKNHIFDNFWHEKPNFFDKFDLKNPILTWRTKFLTNFALKNQIFDM